MTDTIIKRASKVPPEYGSWRHMKRRCLDPNYPQYSEYGGRGITVCARWRDSFKAFLLDMGSRPSAKHSIDRIDNNRGYEPGNCRWVTQKVQANNTRKTIWANVDGVKKTLADVCNDLGYTNVPSVRHACSIFGVEEVVRIMLLGMPLPRKKSGIPKGTAKRPITFDGKTQSITQWAKEFGCGWSTIGSKIKRFGECEAMKALHAKYCGT